MNRYTGNTWLKGFFLANYFGIDELPLALLKFKNN